MTGDASSEPRDQALLTLYQADRIGNPGSLEALSPKARRLVEGVLTQTDELDRTIAEVSAHWSIERMPVIDRAILRLGLYELRHVAATPAAVVVNEAVRLAKTYSTQRSGAFVNGVLASLAETERAEDQRDPS